MNNEEKQYVAYAVDLCFNTYTWYSYNLYEKKHLRNYLTLVPCSYGHYYLNRDCLSCPIGTYQNDVGQVFCRRCPEGWTTEGTDSVSKDDCNG